MHQLLTMFGDVYRALSSDGTDDLGAATRQKLLTFFWDPHKTAPLMTELASIINWGEAIV